MTDLATLERTYRRAVEYAEAQGITLTEAMGHFIPETRAELLAYIEVRDDEIFGQYLQDSEGEGA